MAFAKKKRIFQEGEDFELSRSKIELFEQCQRCFFLDARLGVKTPSSFPFTLNNAVDSLLKKEFDMYRSVKKAHPLVIAHGLTLIPYQHKDLDVWRDPFKGIRYTDPNTNFIVYGGVDDLWTNGESIYIVDYKATSKEGVPTLNALWQDGYKRQAEIYQWLFLKNGFSVSQTAYFVYTNADKNQESFHDTLHFNTTIIPYNGSTDWIDQTLMKIKKLLLSDEVPPIGIKDDEVWDYSLRKKVPVKKQCELCTYRESSGKAFKDFLSKK
ncbi:MAG: PD-(D/E)XK nuclease family protein [Alphaproteobacteria bacterium]|nr:PD-(D/E)XK nuclease family protein [Alphaproteobacteria bacterium]